MLSLWLHAMVSLTKQNALSCPGNPTTGDTVPPKFSEFPVKDLQSQVPRTAHLNVDMPQRVGQCAHSVPRGPGHLIPTGCGRLGPILDSRTRAPWGPGSGSCLPKFPSSPGHRCQFFLTWFCMSSYHSVLNTSMWKKTRKFYQKLLKFAHFSG